MSRNSFSGLSLCGLSLCGLLLWGLLLSGTAQAVPIVELPFVGAINLSTDPGLATTSYDYVVSATSTVDPGSVTTSRLGGPDPSGLLGIGVHSITWQATDVESTITWGFVIVVEDNEAPVISGVPTDFEVFAPLTDGGALVDWMAPVASDNDFAYLSRIQGLASGSFFSFGSWDIGYRAQDGNSNTSEAFFNITVKPMVATVPAPATLALFGLGFFGLSLFGSGRFGHGFKRRND